MDLIADLRAAFSGKLLTDTDDVAPFVTDWRKLWTGQAIGVAFPQSTEEVAAIVRWCAGAGVAVVPQGGNTSLSGGATPEATGQNLVLSLTRMNRLRAVDPVNNTMTVDAGRVLADVQNDALAVDRCFPLSLAAEGSCTIGGNLAANAGGTGVLRYGNARELCLGLEVVTASGEIWSSLKGLRKDNTGYDLRDLYVGSEGTLGVITGAVLKLFPNPVARVVALTATPSCEAAMALFGKLTARHSAALTAFELVSRDALDLVLKHFPSERDPFEAPSPWYVLVEFAAFESEDLTRGDLEEILGSAMEDGLVEDAVVAASMAQSKALWGLRENVSEAQSAEGYTVKHDVAVPISDIPEFVREATAALTGAFSHVRPIIFGHLGDGSLHFNVSPRTREDGEALRRSQNAVNGVVHAIALAHSGTISAEHGLGVLRRDECDRHRSDVERGLMRAVKQALDPRGIMNPGKYLPL